MHHLFVASLLLGASLALPHAPRSGAAPERSGEGSGQAPAVPPPAGDADLPAPALADFLAYLRSHGERDAGAERDYHLHYIVHKKRAPLAGHVHVAADADSSDLPASTDSSAAIAQHVLYISSDERADSLDLSGTLFSSESAGSEDSLLEDDSGNSGDQLGDEPDVVSQESELSSSGEDASLEDASLEDASLEDASSPTSDCVHTPSLTPPCDNGCHKHRHYKLTFLFNR